MSFTEMLDARTSRLFFPNLPPPGRSTLLKGNTIITITIAITITVTVTMTITITITTTTTAAAATTATAAGVAGAASTTTTTTIINKLQVAETVVLAVDYYQHCYYEQRDSGANVVAHSGN